MQVHDSVAHDPQARQLGAQFNGLYARTLREARQQYASVMRTPPQDNPRQHEAERTHYNALVLDYVRTQSEAFLDQHPPERQTAILRGAMVSREMNATAGQAPPSDAAFWQRGRVAETSLRALSEVGLLGEIHEETTARGTRLVRYPTPQQAQRQAHYEAVEIKQVWFNREIAGKPSPPSMQGIDPTTQKQRKAEVHALASRPHEQGGFIGKRLRVEQRTFGTGSRSHLVFADEGGAVFGVIPRHLHTLWEHGQTVVLRTAKGSDGNLKAMVERVE